MRFLSTAKAVFNSAVAVVVAVGREVVHQLAPIVALVKCFLVQIVWPTVVDVAMQTVADMLVAGDLLANIRSTPRLVSV